MRRGEQSLPTIRRVEAEVEKINNTGVLPPACGLKKSTTAGIWLILQRLPSFT